MNRQEIDSFAKTIFGNNSSAIRIAQATLAPYTFSYGDILIMVTPKNNLEDGNADITSSFKQSMDDLFRKSPYYNSTTFSSRGIKYVVTKHFSKDVGYYNCLGLNTEYSKSVSWSLQFKRGQAKQANDLLNNILTKTTFIN
ncbi:hypothetical protein DYU05_06230 [Mucilaginibacter terrenus]|uniref:Uncharacterized protein n=1 Tax=Mucilaginibacter terrenus TaxID=2482727 RepID=A0A3E2NW06_9SPHI|nr:hypothetical protein [Mucilaginibacter terrenus]RFZ85195.1 hypothetical protein DYU05_06230 [Mucilaginibacter terrenus]